MMLARPGDDKARKVLKRFEVCACLASMAQISLVTAGVIWVVVPTGYYPMLWPAILIVVSLVTVVHLVLLVTYLFLFPLRRMGAVLVIQRSTQYALFKRLRWVERASLPSTHERRTILFNLQQVRNDAAVRAGNEYLRTEFERLNTS